MSSHGNRPCSHWRAATEGCSWHPGLQLIEDYRDTAQGRQVLRLRYVTQVRGTLTPVQDAPYACGAVGGHAGATDKHYGHCMPKKGCSRHRACPHDAGCWGQVSNRPPTFAAFIAGAEDMGDSTTRFLLNALRKKFGFPGVPLRLVVRHKGQARIMAVVAAVHCPGLPVIVGVM